MKITIKTYGGPVKIEAEKISKHLYIHPFYYGVSNKSDLGNNFWTVTAMPHGLCFGEMCCESAARRVAKKYADLPWEKAKCDEMKGWLTKTATRIFDPIKLELWEMKCPKHKGAVLLRAVSALRAREQRGSNIGTGERR